MKQLIENIERWAEERNLINGSTPQKQSLKFIEELGELAAGINKSNPKLIKDALGDMAVVVIILAKMMDVDVDGDAFDHEELTGNKYDFIAQSMIDITYFIERGDTFKFLNTDYVYSLLRNISLLALTLDFDIKDCLSSAYNTIKARKGLLVNGVFVKQSDLI